MSKTSKRESSIPNSLLKPLSVLVGKWDTVGTHPLFPATTFHGHSSFEWIEEGAFLIMHSDIEEPGIPSGIAVFGSDDSTEEYFMLYHDERGVSRKFEVTLRDNVWKWWRNAPGFSQRFTGTFSDKGNVITGISELSKDGSKWERDLELTYTRVK